MVLVPPQPKGMKTASATNGPATSSDVTTRADVIELGGGSQTGSGKGFAARGTGNLSRRVSDTASISCLARWSRNLRRWGVQGHRGLGRHVFLSILPSAPRSAAATHLVGLNPRRRAGSGLDRG
jgi:hypothetical protein